MDRLRLQKLLDWEKQSPQDPFLKFAIATEYVSANDDHSAQVYFQMLIQQHPDYLPTYYQLGSLLARSSAVSAAKETYKKGILVAKNQGDTKTLRELNEAVTQLDDE